MKDLLKIKDKGKTLLRKNRIWLYPSMFVAGCTCIMLAAVGWKICFVLSFFLIPPFPCSVANHAS